MSPLIALIFIIFLPHFFSFAIESYLYATDFTADPSPLIIGSNIDILHAADSQPLEFSAIFMVTSTTICIQFEAQTMCETRFDSQGMILNVFKNHF